MLPLLQSLASYGTLPPFFRLAFVAAAFRGGRFFLVGGHPEERSPRRMISTSASWLPTYKKARHSERSGPEVDAPKALGGEDLPPLGPAPGSYVMEK